MTRLDRRLGGRGRRFAEPKGRVGVLDVLLGPSGSAVRRHLRGTVGFGELGMGPVFGQKSFGHPTAGRDAERLGGPPPGLVRAGLAAADDLFEHDRRPVDAADGVTRSSLSREDDCQQKRSILDPFERVGLAGRQIQELSGFEHLRLAERGEGHPALQAVHDDFPLLAVLGDFLARPDDQSNDFHRGGANQRPRMSGRQRGPQGPHVDRVARIRGRFRLGSRRRPERSP